VRVDADPLPDPRRPARPRPSLVLAVNEQTNQIAPKRVTALIRPEAKPLYQVILVDASGEAAILNATEDHPWLSKDKGWIETVFLRPGERIKTGSGSEVVIKSLLKTDRTERTYNLTVAEWHTFMVGEDRTIVHNVDCKKRVPGKAGKEAAKDVPSWARGQAPYVGESGRAFAERLLNASMAQGIGIVQDLAPSSACSRSTEIEVSDEKCPICLPGSACQG